MQLFQRTILTVSISLALLPMLSGCSKPADTAGNTNNTSTFGSSTGAETTTSAPSTSSSESASTEASSAGASSAGGAGAGSVDASLPKVKVDAAHNGSGMSEEGAVKYLIAPGKGFALDLGDYAWPSETPETKGGSKSIQVSIAGQDRPYRVNYVEGTKVYAVEPFEGFKTGQKAMIGIGREVKTDQVNFHPQWIGYLQVQ